jgi:hypothetical protein
MLHGGPPFHTVYMVRSLYGKENELSIIYNIWRMRNGKYALYTKVRDESIDFAVGVW